MDIHKVGGPGGRPELGSQQPERESPPSSAEVGGAGQVKREIGKPVGDCCLDRAGVAEIVGLA